MIGSSQAEPLPSQDCYSAGHTHAFSQCQAPMIYLLTDENRNAPRAVNETETSRQKLSKSRPNWSSKQRAEHSDMPVWAMIYGTLAFGLPMRSAAKEAESSITMRPFVSTRHSSCPANAKTRLVLRNDLARTPPDLTAGLSCVLRND